MTSNIHTYNQISKGIIKLQDFIISIASGGFAVAGWDGITLGKRFRRNAIIFKPQCNSIGVFIQYLDIYESRNVVK